MTRSLSAKSVSSSDFLIGRMLGQTIGIPGSVHLAKYTRTEDLFVVKKYSLEESDNDKDSENFEYMTHEVSVLRHLRHPNILPCLASIVQGKEVVLVSPLMEFGSAKDLISSHFNEGLPEIAIAAILKEVLTALGHLHSQGIIHRSVRASHILISASGRVCLSGFNYSCSMIENGIIQDKFGYSLHVASTNLNWMSPEMLQQNLLGYNEKTDIYSLAVATCEMANGVVPFSDMSPTLMFLEKLRGVPPRLYDKSTYSSSLQHDLNHGGIYFASDQPADSGVGAGVGSCSNMTNKDSIYKKRAFLDSFHDFVGAASKTDPIDRPSAIELLAAPFIKQLKKGTISIPALLAPVQPLTQRDFSQLDPSSQEDLMHREDAVTETDWSF